MKAVIEDCKKLRKLCLVLKKERSKGSLNILSKTMIRTNADRGCLELVATDLDTTKILRLPAVIEEPGCAVVDIMDLDKYAKNIKKVGGQLTLETEDNGWLQVNHEKLETRLVGVRPEEFPDIVEPDDRFGDPVDLDGDEFFRVIDACYPAIFTDTTNPELTGLYFDGDDAVATDGHRMQCRKLDTDFDQKIVPHSAIKVARYAWEKYKPERVRMQEADDHVAIHIGDHTITSRCIDADGEFPDYMQVLPDGDEATTVRVDRSDVLQALDLLEPVISSTSKGVQVTLNNDGLELYANSADSGEAKAFIGAEVDGSVSRMKANGGYLYDALESFEDDRVTLAVSGMGVPIVFREDSRPEECAMVMPMKF